MAPTEVPFVASFVVRSATFTPGGNSSGAAAPATRKTFCRTSIRKAAGRLLRIARLRVRRKPSATSRAPAASCACCRCRPPIGTRTAIIATMIASTMRTSTRVKPVHWRRLSPTPATLAMLSPRQAIDAQDRGQDRADDAGDDDPQPDHHGWPDQCEHAIEAPTGLALEDVGGFEQHLLLPAARFANPDELNREPRKDFGLGEWLGQAPADPDPFDDARDRVVEDPIADGLVRDRQGSHHRDAVLEQRAERAAEADNLNLADERPGNRQPQHQPIPARAARRSLELKTKK